MIIAKKKTLYPYEQAAEFLPMFKAELLAESREVREKTREIRIRAGQPVTLELNRDRRVLNICAQPEDLRDLLERFCDYSLHSYGRQLAEGFITLEGGHRAGFCGTAVMNNNKVEAIRDISSINLRIAREFIGCSDELYTRIPAEDIKALLIIGKPMSAKTTILRDFARNLSHNYKVTIIDERGEIAAKRNGIITNNLGLNTDVLDSFPKKTGFITALRALSPDFIVCDEVADEGNSVSECLNMGVRLVMTAHCGSLEEAVNSKVLTGIINQISHIASLGTGVNIGRLTGLWKKNKFENRTTDVLSGGFRKNEDDFSSVLCCNGFGNRLVSIDGA